MQTSRSEDDPDKKYRSVLSAGTLAGDSVRNSAGEDLGKVDEIMIDIPSGRVAYAVLSFGGVLRMGNKLFAVPWSSLVVDEDEKCFILDVDQKTLESAPGFDKDDWPTWPIPPGEQSVPALRRHTVLGIPGSQAAARLHVAMPEKQLPNERNWPGLVGTGKSIRARRDRARPRGPAWGARPSR